VEQSRKTKVFFLNKKKVEPTLIAADETTDRTPAERLAVS
jgi:hypothetical protein